LHISQLAAPFRFNEVQTKIFSIRAKANRAATEKTNDLKQNEQMQRRKKKEESR